MDIQIKVVLDNPSAVYHAGGTVTGNVIVNAQKEERTEGIKVKLDGRAIVDWTEKDRRFTNSEVYLDVEESLLADASNPATLPAGESTYAFSLTIPKKALPGTFTGANGKVEYSVEATLSNQKAREVFIVGGILDLSFGGGTFSRSQSTTSGCLFCTDGPLSLKISSRSTGFTPGQKISVKVEVNNQSKRQVDDVSLELIERTDYKAGTAKSQTNKVIANALRGRPVERGDNEEWQAEVVVPQAPPSGLGGGSGKLIIDVQYIVKVELHVIKNAIKMLAGVLIGTVPLHPFVTYPEDQ